MADTIALIEQSTAVHEDENGAADTQDTEPFVDENMSVMSDLSLSLSVMMPSEEESPQKESEKGVGVSLDNPNPFASNGSYANTTGDEIAARSPKAYPKRA